MYLLPPHLLIIAKNQFGFPVHVTHVTRETRQHSKQLISKTAELYNRDYIVRMLYRDAYRHMCQTGSQLIFDQLLTGM